MRRWWNALSPSERRAKTARRNAARVRDEDRLKQAKRRSVGTSEQKLKIWARDQVRLAIMRGDLKKQPCEVCGTLTSLQAHHDDYDKPLEVRWLCRRHHEALHV
jgi:hypothetical protein